MKMMCSDFDPEHGYFQLPWMTTRRTCSWRWKKWSAPGTTDHRQLLRPRPVEHAASGMVSSSSPWITIVSGRHRRRLEVPHRHADQHHALGLDCAARACVCTAAPNEKPASTGFCACGIFENGEEILDLAAALVVRAFARADAAEVRPPGRVAEVDEGARQRLHHLVVERAAVQRMRVRDERDAARLRLRARRPRTRSVPPGRRSSSRRRAGAHHIRSRSTTRPCRRCSSMISSMSARST